MQFRELHLFRRFISLVVIFSLILNPLQPIIAANSPQVDSLPITNPATARPAANLTAWDALPQLQPQQGQANVPNEPVYLYNGSQLGRTLNFHDGFPQWRSIKNNFLDDIRQFILDPSDPDRRGIIISSSGIWLSTNLDAPANVVRWTRTLGTEEIRKDYLRLTSDNPGDCLKFFNGANAIAADPHNPGVFTVNIAVGTDWYFNSCYPMMYRTTNGGKSWTPSFGSSALCVQLRRCYSG